MTAIIEVVRIALDAMPRRDLDALTSRAEREAAGRRRQAIDARRYLARRAAMRLNAAAILHAEPADIALANDANGRPEIPGTDLHISQSSRGGVMIAAFCRDRPIGCDLELMRPDIDIDAIAAICFGPTERRMLNAAITPLRLKMFYDIWTRKEAYLKATGTGMTVNMAHVETTHRPGPATAWGRVDWTSESWNPLPDHVAAVVARGDWTLARREAARSPASASI